MSSGLMDGISNAYTLMKQMDELKKGGETQGTKQQLADSARVELERSFNQILNSLLSPTKTEEEKKEENDPFAFLIASSQEYVRNLVKQQGLEVPETLSGA